MTLGVGPPVVVVGASLAGIRVVQSLRDHGYAGPIVLVGAESELPYDRPPLSKALMRSDAGPEYLVREDELAELDVDLHLGVRATGLDLALKQVALYSGESITYSSLVIATGSVPCSIPEWGSPPGVHYLRTFEDCVDLRGELTPGARLVIIGAGFIGAEIASTARGLGVEVTVLDNTQAPLTRAIGPFFAETTEAIHRDAGVDLYNEVSVARIEGEGRVRGVRLADGRFMPADAVLVCIGARPAVDWLQGSGLTLDDGVVCDAGLSAAPDVYAVGDVCNFPNVLLGERMRVEHWTNAGEQATYVAKSIASGAAGSGFGSLPFVWSEQFGYKIEVVGRPRRSDTIRLIEGSLEERRFLAAYQRDGRDVGAIAFNAPGSMFRLRRRLLAELTAAHSLEGTGKK